MEVVLVLAFGVVLEALIIVAKVRAYEDEGPCPLHGYLGYGYDHSDCREATA